MWAGTEALDRVPNRVPEDGFPCLLWHGGLRGGLVGVGGVAGADLLKSVHHVHPFSTSRSPDPLHAAAELPGGGGRPPGEVGGGLGGGRATSSRSWSGGGGGWGWIMRTGGAGNEKLDAVPLGEGAGDMGRGWCVWR